MKRSELKVGMKIRHPAYRNREVLAIGVGTYYYRDSHANEGVGDQMILGQWEPLPEEPELFYIWAIKGVDFMRKDSEYWYLVWEYISEDGKRTDGHRSISNWDSKEKRILTEFEPIDKDGRVYPRGER